MFSVPSVRSSKEIQKGLLTRAFKRGGKEEQEKMQLLIDWRLAACHHEAKQSLQELEDKYNVEEFNANDFEDSRYLSAFNFTQHMDGKKETLRTTISSKDMGHLMAIDDGLKAKLKAEILEQEDSVAEHNKLMDLIANAPQIDLDSIQRRKLNTTGETAAQYKIECQRSPEDKVYMHVENLSEATKKSFGITESPEVNLSLINNDDADLKSNRTSSYLNEKMTETVSFKLH